MILFICWRDGERAHTGGGSSRGTSGLPLSRDPDAGLGPGTLRP